MELTNRLRRAANRCGLIGMCATLVCLIAIVVILSSNYHAMPRWLLGTSAIITYVVTIIGGIFVGSWVLARIWTNSKSTFTIAFKDSSENRQNNNTKSGNRNQYEKVALTSGLIGALISSFVLAFRAFNENPPTFMDIDVEIAYWPWLSALLSVVYPFLCGLATILISVSILAKLTAWVVRLDVKHPGISKHKSWIFTCLGSIAGLIAMWFAMMYFASEVPGMSNIVRLPPWVFNATRSLAWLVCLVAFELFVLSLLILIRKALPRLFSLQYQD